MSHVDSAANAITFVLLDIFQLFFFHFMYTQHTCQTIYIHVQRLLLLCNDDYRRITKLYLTK